MARFATVFVVGPRVAGLLKIAPLVAILSTATTHADAQEVPNSERPKAEQAADAFREAMSAVDEGRLEKAVEQFRSAFDADPHPFTLYNLCMILSRLQRHREAADLLQRFLRERSSTLPDEEMRELALLLQTEYGHVARLVVDTAPASAEILVGGLPQPGPGLILDPGTHELSFRAEGYEPRTAAITVEAGEQLKLAVFLDQAVAERPTASAISPKPHAPEPWADVPLADAQADSDALYWPRWGVTGAASVLLASALAVAVINKGRYESWRDDEQSVVSGDASDWSDTRFAAHQDLGASIQTWDGVAVGAAAGGAIMAGIATWLWVMGDEKPSQSRMSAGHSKPLTWTLQF